MKRIFGLSLWFGLFASFAAPLHSYAQIGNMVPIEVSEAPTEVYVPPGFDANDLTEVWIEGVYENTCEKFRPVTRADIDFTQLKEGKIVIHNKNYHYQGFMCLPMMSKYKKRIELGAIGVPKVDGYDLAFQNEKGDEVQKEPWKLKVNEVEAKYTTKDHQFGPDNDYYAPVDKFDIVYLKKEDRYLIVLEGEFSNSAMRIIDVKTLTHDNVIEVIPYMEHPKENEVSATVLSRFRSKPWLIPSVPSRRTLVHVRTLGGNSASDIVDFTQQTKENIVVK